MKLRLSSHGITITLLAALLQACGGGGGNGPSGPTLSADQQIFEHAELNGGSYSIGYSLPYGGGTLISGQNLIYSSSSGGLKASPLTSGPQKQTSQYNTLDSALSLPTFATTRYLIAGKVYVRSVTAASVVSYVGNAIRIDSLADDGQTIVTSSQYSNFSEVALSGMIDNAPEEFQAKYPVDDWVSGNNFSANA